MTIDLAMIAIAAIVVIGPIVALAAAAFRYGVDSRPGIDDHDHRPWLVGR